MSSTSEQLQEIIHTPSRELRLAEASLLLGKEIDKRVDVEKYLGILDLYADRVAQIAPPKPSLGDVIYALNTVLFFELGFTGTKDTEKSPVNCLLHRLLECKQGGTISMAILYLEVGRRVGIELVSVLFPGHTLIGARSDEGEVILDPMNGGLQVMKEELVEIMRGAYGNTIICDTNVSQILRESDDRELLVSLFRHLKGAFLSLKEREMALKMIEAIQIISPGSATELRERAKLYENMGYNIGAIADYNQYLEQFPDALDAFEVKERLVLLLHEDVPLH